MLLQATRMLLQATGMLLQRFIQILKMVDLKISKCKKVDLKMSKNDKKDEKLKIKCQKCSKVEHFENQTTPFLVRYDLGPKKWIFSFILSENNDAHCVYIDFDFSRFFDNLPAFQGSLYCIWRPQKIKIRPPNSHPATIIYKMWCSRNDYIQILPLSQGLLTKWHAPASN